MTTKSGNQLELLRSNIMSAAGVEEKVEVNQRHLIDKILARYSAEYVLYRELMQNADDAGSSSIQIYFYTNSPDPSKPPNLLSKCERIVFKNNGMAFRPEDWLRLKRIAEGNPDEQKIGAFGVGFYSLFSVCENPFVFSGSQCMAFYFKGDQLFAKRADVPEKEVDPWTSFLMDLREPMEMPDFDHFCKFLTTSMGFTANLKQMSVFFDNQQIFSLTKRVAEPRSMAVDARKMILSSPQRMFTITGADMRQIQLDSEKYTPPSLFAPLTNFLTGNNGTSSAQTNQNGLPVEKGSIFLRVVTGLLQVSVSRDYEKEMERATKKKPPKTTKFQLVYTGKEEIDASENRNEIFKDLIPFPQQGRVFIGFPTHQTTGCCCHMASRFIPTVERESIDFADRYISVWNKELLAVGGLLARLVYNDEMDQISRLYRELVGSSTEVDKTQVEGTDSAKLMLEKRAAHALHSFTFQPSTPSPIVSIVHEDRFFNSCKVSLEIMSSHGTKPINLVRTIPDHTTIAGHVITELLDVFVKTIPTITPILFQECKESLFKLASSKLLTPLGLNDVLNELGARSLKPDEMVACMKWWIECNKGNICIPATTRANMNTNTRAEFLDAAVMDCGEDKGLLQLSRTKWWLNPKIIPLDMPIPHDTMPFSISKKFNQTDLASYFANMNELSIYHWAEFITLTKPELESSKEFAEKILSIVSRQYAHISTKTQQDIVSLLAKRKCIPTRFGLKLSQESYFPSVNLFDDLPVIEFSHTKAVSDIFLTALGVRKHVELQMVFDRLISDGSWSHIELVKYLASVQGTLTEIETRRLRETAIFTKEGEEPLIKEIKKHFGRYTEDGQPLLETKSKNIFKRYRACDLFAPTEIARELNLPLILWSSKWKHGSAESKFLEKLGLITSPPLATLLMLAAPDQTVTSDRQKIQKRALAYLIEHRQDYQSTYDINKIQIKFLPCTDGKYATPRDCFTNPDVQLLGFQVLHSDLIPVRDKLGVNENPSADKVLQAFMAKKELDTAAAQKIFEFMDNRMGGFSNSQWGLLRQLAFIPVKENSIMVLKEPSQVYFESDNSATFHKELFLFVNFGQHGNSFLRSCGVKDEPTTVELAAMMVKNPQRFWDLSSGGERYLSALRQIANQSYLIKSNKQLWNDMKTKPFLVGTKRTALIDQQFKTIEGDDDEFKENKEFTQYTLAKASDIFIIDDTMGHQIFAPLSAPMEAQLEEFYASLGSKMLSTQIREAYSYASNMGITTRTKEITEMIFERTPIIIYQMMNDNPQRRKELVHDERYVKQNLKVTQVKYLKITRTFKHTNQKDIQPTTSCADRVNFGIYISNSSDLDYYDIANSLCSLIFARVRFNDAIVVERYLTASLLNLRKKGVPVDRILNIRKQAIATPPVHTPSPAPSTPQAPSPAVPPRPPSLTPKDIDKYTEQIQIVFGDCQEGYIRQLVAQQSENHVENVIGKLLHDDYPRTKQHGKEVVGAVSSEEEEEKMRIKEAKLAAERVNKERSGFMNRFLSNWRQPTPPPPPPPPSAPENEITKQIEKQTQKPKLPQSDSTITPNFTSNIRQNLKRAIHSCKPYAGQDVYSPPRINQVNESVHYCDNTPGQNLTYIGNVMGMEFYVHRNVRPDDVLEQYGQAMARFTSVLTDLAKVFELPLNTVQLFYDNEGPTIAFNLSGSLFMNLRYYLALHEPQDKKEEATKRKEAMIYWFMTMCHELAHNFVAEHSSQHEFYMSSFAENYLESLMAYFYQPATPRLMNSTFPSPSLTLLD